MDRRNFLRTLVGGVAGAAAARAWPFRVYSFPSKIVIPKFNLNPAMLEAHAKTVGSVWFFNESPKEPIRLLHLPDPLDWTGA